MVKAMKMNAPVSRMSTVVAFSLARPFADNRKIRAWRHRVCCYSAGEA
jgi:hypothetical protein